MERTWAYREFQKGIVAAGLQDVEWHDLRRTRGCRLLQDKGFTLLQVSRWLGHSSVRVTEKHYAFEALRIPICRRPGEGPRHGYPRTGCSTMNRPETMVQSVCPFLCPRVLRSLRVPLSSCYGLPVFAGEFGGHARNRTGVRGFAVRCVTTPPRGPTRRACIMRPFRVAMAARAIAWPPLVPRPDGQQMAALRASGLRLFPSERPCLHCCSSALRRLAAVAGGECIG